MSKKKLTLLQLSDILSAEIIGDSSVIISGIASLHNATTTDVSFFEKPKYKKCLSDTRAAAVILTREHVGFLDIKKTAAIVVEQPYLSYAIISKIFYEASAAVSGLHPTVVIGEKCDISPVDVSVGPFCVIGNGVKIAERVCIGSHCSISDNVSIGSDTVIFPGVVIYQGVSIGNRVIIHSGAIIGADGFGNAMDVKTGCWKKIYQLGSVIIGDDVEIGANTAIDRGALDNTVIEQGVKLDNLIQIGHNVRVGANSAIAGCVGVAGSAKIGKNCMIGGGACINGHIDIADGTVITGMSGVAKSIDVAGVYASGVPAMPHREWWRILKRLSQLEDVFKFLDKREKE